MTVLWSVGPFIVGPEAGTVGSTSQRGCRDVIVYKHHAHVGKARGAGSKAVFTKRPKDNHSLCFKCVIVKILFRL